MDDESARLLQRIRALRTYRQGERRAPHKPLLLLFAISRLQRGVRKISFSDVEQALSPLLNAYAPPVKGRHQPALPYWHLTTDGLWTVDDANQLDRQATGFPTMAALRNTTAGFTKEVADQLANNAALMRAVVRQLLDEHFAPSTHDDILNALGLETEAVGLENAELVAEASFDYVDRKRSSTFRSEVLRAYEFRCAFSGFRAALNGSYFGCEAAHVQWHSHSGPDRLSNGIALEPTIHKLFDVGAWSLTDDRRIIVSAHFTGSDESVERVRGRHGQPLRSPLPGEPMLDPQYIKWHREPSLGGVFRAPALSL